MYQSIGVDLSKTYFDADLPGVGVKRFKNTDSGIRQFLRRLPDDARCVMESTGNYGYRLATALVKADIATAMVNPLSVKRFSQMKLRRAKTDRADARLLTEYGKIVELSPFVPSTDAQSELEQLEGVYNQLMKQRTALLNQLEALRQLPYQSKDALAALVKAIQEIEKALEGLRKKMHKRAITAYPAVLMKATSVPGIGERIAIALINVTHGFERFHTHKELVAYLGVCPRVTQSGTSVTAAGHICKAGFARVRSLLYMGALSAIKFNQPCRELYLRLTQKGKPKMVALLAVVNKLIRQVFAVVTHNVLFNEKYHRSFAF
jgi:transposase